MIKLHRCGGFIFNNIVVDNTNNIYLLDIIRNCTPQKTRYDFIVPKRNGSQTFDNRYEDNYIDVVVGVYDLNIETRRIRQRQLLQNMINVNSKLIFLDEPQLFYNAEIIDAIETNEGEVFTELTIHFKASYCKYGVEHNITLAKGTNSINNTGNYQAETFLTIAVTANSNNIIIGNGVRSFTLQNLLAGETIYVDSEKMISYKIVGSNKQSVMTRFTGQFLQLEKGTSIVTVSGTYTAAINLKYKDTYIV